MKTNLLTGAVLALLGVSMSMSAQLTNLPLTAVEDLVPSHYDGTYDKMEFTISDPFDYVPAAYDNPTSTTPAPEQQQVNDNSCFVPLSLTPNIESRGYDPSTFWSDYPYANNYLFEFAIPEGQSLKYIDIWGRVNAAIDWRHQNLIVELYNDAVVSKSSTFNVGKSDADYPAFVRLDLTEQGFTDNLTSLATGVRIRHRDGKRKDFLHLMEVRMVTEANPNVETDKPVLSDVSSGAWDENTNLTAKSSKNTTIYMVPAVTELNVVAIQGASVTKFSAQKDSMYTFSSVGIEPGDYKLYALDLSGNLSEASETITLKTDVNKPVITGIETKTVPVTTWVYFTGNEKGRAYMVPKSTAADSASITGSAVAEKYFVKDEESVISTYNVPSSIYVIYAIDLAGNISAVSPEITLLDKDPMTLETFAITGGIGGTPNYESAGALNQVRYCFTDPFAYDPNSPTAVEPWRQWAVEPAGYGVEDSSAFIPKAGQADAWITFDISIPADQKLEVLDVWGRGDANVSSGARHKNLVFTLSDDEGNSWSSQTWSAMTTQSETPSSYGRFDFSTADVQPASLLSYATKLDVRHAEGDDNMLSIFEVRIAGKVWANTRPIASAGDPQTVKAGSVVTLDASGTIDPDASQTLTYMWIAAGLQLSSMTAEQPTFTAPMVTAETKFTILLTVNDGIEGSLPATVVITVTPDDTEIADVNIDGAKVYPNPSSNGFSLDLSLTAKASTIQVMDLAGKSIFSGMADAGAVYQISSDVFPSSGMYILMVENDGKEFVQQLIVK